MATLFETVTSDPFTQAYNNRIAAVERAAAARRAASQAPVVEEAVANPADELISRLSAAAPTSATVSTTPTGPSRDIGFWEDISLIPERFRVGAQNLVGGRRNVLNDIYGAENITPYGEDNFLIREPDGQTRLYNQEGWAPTYGDIASIIPEVVGTVGGGIGGAFGGAAGSVVPVVGNIGGAAAGGAAGYVGAKNAAAQGISALFGDSNPTSLSQLGWDALEGSTEAFGPILRAAAPAVKGLATSALTPVRSTASRLSSSAAPTDSLMKIVGDPRFDNVSNTAASAARDIFIGADPTLASVAGPSGQRALGRMAGLSDVVAEGNDLLVADMGKYADDFLTRSEDALGANRDALYAGLDPNAIADVSPIRSVLASKAASTPDFAAAVRGSDGLAKESMDLFDRTVKTPGATSRARGMSKAEKERQSLLGILNGTSYDDVTKGTLTQIYRDKGFVPGLKGPAATLQDEMVDAFRLANPELAVADAQAAPISKALNKKNAPGTFNWADELIDAQDTAKARANAAGIAFDDTANPLTGLRDIINQQAAKVAQDDYKQLARAIGGRTSGPGALMARGATAAFHPVAGTVGVLSSVVGPRMLGKAFRGTKGVDAAVRAAENRRLRQAAAKAVGGRGLSSVPGVRAFDPAYRAAIDAQNLQQLQRADAFADLVPNAAFNPFSETVALPSMGTLGAGSVDEYIQGLKQAYLSETLGRGSGKAIAEDNRSEGRKNKGAFD